jgi:hypothetical protein
MRRILLVCGALLVGAVVLALIDKAYLHDGGSRGIRTGCNGTNLSKNLAEEKRTLSYMFSLIIEPIKISSVEHQVSKQLASCHCFYLLPTEGADNGKSAVSADKLRKVFRRIFILIENRPRLLQLLPRWSAFIDKTQIFSRRVSTIKKTGTKIDRNWGCGLANNSWLRAGDERHKGPLAYDVVAADYPRLGYLNPSVSENSEQRQQTYVILWLVPVAFFLVSGIGLYHGLPRRNAMGFIIVLGASVCWILGTILALSLIFPSSSMAENVSSALEIGASAPCHGRAENVCVLPIVVSELEFRNV